MVLDDATAQQGLESLQSHDDERDELFAHMRCVARHRAPAYKRRDAFFQSGLMTLGTWLFTKMRGEPVGTDDQGNRYYQDKRLIAGHRRKRWVIYQGEAEASRVPPDWHGWLHYTTNSPPPNRARRSNGGKSVWAVPSCACRKKNPCSTASFSTLSNLPTGSRG